MSKATAGAGLVTLSLLGACIALSVPPANAADLDAQVQAIDGCVWSLAGSPELINLTAGQGVKYEGAELGMSFDFSGLSIGLAGSRNIQSANEGNSTECSFYGDVKNSKIELTLNTTSQFSASYGAGTRDGLMDFNLSGTNPLAFTASPVGSCVGDSKFTLSNSKSMTAVDFLPWRLIETGASANDYGPAANLRCGINLLMEVRIPDYVGVPAGAGSNYSFSGPGLTISLLNVD